MHVPEKWNMGSLAKQQFIDDFGFATLISKDLEASHLPLLLDTTVGEYGTLYGHFARANPHWENNSRTVCSSHFYWSTRYIRYTSRCVFSVGIKSGLDKA